MTGPTEPRELLAGERTVREIRRWLREFEHMPDEKIQFVRAMHRTVSPDLGLDAGEVALTLLYLAGRPDHHWIGRALVEVAIALADDVATEVAVDDLTSDLDGLGNAPEGP